MNAKEARALVKSQGIAYKKKVREQKFKSLLNSIENYAKDGETQLKVELSYDSFKDQLEKLGFDAYSSGDSFIIRWDD